TAIGLIIGQRAGDRVPVIDGLPPAATEDQLKALGAAAATTGSVGLFHAVGITPEAPTLDAAFRGEPPVETVDVTGDDLRTALRQLSTVSEGVPISAVCLGTPHFSRAEWDRLITALERTARPRVPVYVNTGRATLAALEADAAFARLQDANLVVVTDTCT